MWGLFLKEPQHPPLNSSVGQRQSVALQLGLILGLQLSGLLVARMANLVSVLWMELKDMEHVFAQHPSPIPGGSM